MNLNRADILSDMIGISSFELYIIIIILLNSYVSLTTGGKMQVVHEKNHSRLLGPYQPPCRSGRPLGSHVMQRVSDIPVAQERTGRQANVGPLCTQKSSAHRGSPGRSLPHQQHWLAGLQQAVEQICMFPVLSI